MRPQELYPIFKDIESIKGVGAKTAKLLEKLGIKKVKDLLWHLPSSFIDRRNSPQLIFARENSIITIKVEILEHIEPKSKRSPYKVIATDGTSNITISFFKGSSNYIKDSLPIGQERVISGKIEKYGSELQMTHPDYIVLPEKINEIMTIEPVYPLTQGLSNRVLLKHLRNGLKDTPIFNEWQDEAFLVKKNWHSFNESLNKAHNPLSENDVIPNSTYRERLAYDELLANQLALALVRNQVKQNSGRIIKGDGNLRRTLLEKLSFELTGAQKRVLKEIGDDMASNNRMLRLLQGDVGSGKTIVALFTMLNAIECGFQSAIMAPTDILSTQHYNNFKEILNNINVTVELLTGKTKGKKRQEILSKLANGEIDIIIGTHALFQESVDFKDLACVVIDEQHRFGVHQRLSLTEKGKKADILVMTATPIPRTLTLTSYGDMESSKIDELPKGRKPVITKVMNINKAHELIQAIQRKIDIGEQIYWVCPLVEESEKLDLAAAEDRYEILKRSFGNKVGLVHGKMKAKEKDAVMQEFEQGKKSILVATTVIEVGVNVPNATIMIIEHAERFGLSQLHQLRGRIKRGSNQGNCILLYSNPLTENGRARLEAIKNTEDGFIIAEEDLKLRGAGEILGAKQSGFPDFLLADMNYHSGLLATAYKDAKFILSKDPELKTERGEALRTLLYLFEKDEVIKTYKAG